MSNLNTYALYDIVEKINGGDIEPVGETNYDNKAYWRQKEIEKLADMLIDDLLRVFETKGWERSIEDARKEAKKWFENLKDTVDEILDVKPEETTIRPKGHWISRWHAGHDLHFHVCSECNEEFSCDMETGISIDDYSYCPNCGADNREVVEE